MCTWTGEAATRVDAALTKKAANVMARDEVRAAAGYHASHLEQGAPMANDPNGSEEDKFWSGIGVASSGLARELSFESDGAPPHGNEPSILSKAKTNSAGEVELEGKSHTSQNTLSL